MSNASNVSNVSPSPVTLCGSISHHHGVGTDHSRWLEEDISEAGTDVMVALLRGVDPGRNLNPGTLLPAHREW